MAKRVLLLHEPGAPAEEVSVLADGLRAQGAAVSVRPCEAPYEDVLDAVAAADSVVFWG